MQRVQSDKYFVYYLVIGRLSLERVGWDGPDTRKLFPGTSRLAVESPRTALAKHHHDSPFGAL